jgi:hypothetical protein
MMFRRDVLSLIMARELDIKICADEYLANFAHAIGGTAIIRKVLGMYRRHGANNFSNNAVLGGFVPLTRRTTKAGADPKKAIAECLAHDAERLCDVLGERQFANIVMRFCPVGRGWEILRRNNVGRGCAVHQTVRRLTRAVGNLFREVRRQVSWLLYRQPTYW